LSTQELLYAPFPASHNFRRTRAWIPWHRFRPSPEGRPQSCSSDVHIFFGKALACSMKIRDEVERKSSSDPVIESCPVRVDFLTRHQRQRKCKPEALWTGHREKTCQARAFAAGCTFTHYHKSLLSPTPIRQVPLSKLSFAETPKASFDDHSIRESEYRYPRPHHFFRAPLQVDFLSRDHGMMTVRASDTTRKSRRVAAGKNNYLNPILFFLPSIQPFRNRREQKL
jgi:hypothetical protein